MPLENEGAGSPAVPAPSSVRCAPSRYTAEGGSQYKTQLVAQVNTHWRTATQSGAESSAPDWY